MIEARGIHVEVSPEAGAELETLVDARMLALAGRVRDSAKAILTQEGRVDTGALRQSIITQLVEKTPSSITYAIGSPLPYAIYQELGVAGPVLPRRAKVLRFKPKGSGQFVYARSTKGFKGAHYLTRALLALGPADWGQS